MIPAPALDARQQSVAGRLATLVVAIALVGCSPASPSSVPATSGAPVATPGVSQPAGSGALGSEPALAAALRDAIDPDAIVADLQRLEDIAGANGGNRAAGSDSQSEALTYVGDQLRAAGFDVELREISVPWFDQVGPSVLEVEGAAPLEDLHDFKSMLLSASGDVRGPIYALGFDPAAAPGDRSGLGCQAEDWADVPAGAIVLVRPGPCFRRDVVVNAQDAGAIALVTAYPEWQRDQVLRSTLVDPNGMEIPALAASNDTGLALADAAERGADGHVVVDSTVERRTSSSLIAETAGGSPDHVLMIGGHIDSAIDGPGINDDGSGSMTLLEIGRQLAAATTGPQSAAGDGWRVRLAFWTGEEIGLLGSAAYVEGLDSAEIGSIEAYLNLDMLGSPNGVREIYSGAATTRPTESQAIAGLFASALDGAGLSSSVVEASSGSDHASFNNFGIPTGGLFSGANEIMTAEQAALFGGTAGAPEDPCYHLACDAVANLDPVLLEEMARAGAWVVGALASGEVTLRGS